MWCWGSPCCPQSTCTHLTVKVGHHPVRAWTPRFTLVKWMDRVGSPTSQGISCTYKASPHGALQSCLPSCTHTCTHGTHTHAHTCSHHPHFLWPGFVIPWFSWDFLELCVGYDVTFPGGSELRREVGSVWTCISFLGYPGTQTSWQ